MFYHPLLVAILPASNAEQCGKEFQFPIQSGDAAHQALPGIYVQGGRLAAMGGRDLSVLWNG